MGESEKRSFISLEEFLRSLEIMDEESINKTAYIIRVSRDIKELKDNIIKNKFSSSVEQFLAPLFRKIYLDYKQILINKLETDEGFIDLRRYYTDPLLDEYFVKSKGDTLSFIFSLNHSEIPQKTKDRFKNKANEFMLQKIREYLNLK